MGLDAQAFSRVFPKSRSQQLNGREALERIAESAAGWAERQGLGPCLESRMTSDRTLVVEPLPVVDGIQFDLTDRGIAVGFRSSNGGPGFHAAVIDMLDHMQRELGLDWSWIGSDGTCLDETGYALSRDFSALQGSMAEFLKALSRMVEKSGPDGQALCVPLGYLGEGGQIACPLGFQQPDRLRRLCDADEADLHAAASTFFIWWERPLDARQWEQLLRAQLWQVADWRRPVCAADLTVQRRIEHSARMATANDRAVATDLAAALDELRRLQASGEAPAETGIGYRRRLIKHRLYQSWSMSLPGWLVFNSNDGHATFEHDSLWLGTQSMTIALKPGVEVNWSALYGGYAGPSRELRPGVFCRKSALQLQQDGPGHVQTALVMTAQSGGLELLLLTLSSHLSAPFDAFDSWIATIVAHDNTA
ncbi:MAG: hypothetical protein GC186_18610 [Rhodobacteraceae bacterium]|nr:hypothetical protein [Paracoccaceae bacterium]